MELRQGLKIEQKLKMTQSMQQALSILRMSQMELASYLETVVASNPLLEMEYPESIDEKEELTHTIELDYDDYIHQQVREPVDYLENLSGATEEDFSQMLSGQLVRRLDLSEKLRNLSSYIIYCLDEKGYLRFPLEELAQEQGVSLQDMEKALAIVQSLEPAGVGARNLAECLVLQLERQDKMTEKLKTFIDQGLPFLAEHNFSGLEQLLACTRKEVETLKNIICALNPIPSQGYRTNNQTQYQIPEAEIYVEDNFVKVEIYKGFLPHIVFNNLVQELIQVSKEKKDKEYYKKEVAEAKQLLSCLHNREHTIERILKEVVKKQYEFFTVKDDLQPFTMKELAEKLQLNVSTISRAVQGKTIIFKGKLLPMKMFFPFGVGQRGTEISREEIKKKIKALIASENKKKPLSDAVLVDMLASEKITVSRRVISKYREEMGIKSSSGRKQR